MLLVLAIIAPAVAGVLLLVALYLAWRANTRLQAIQRQQSEEFAALRRAIAELGRSPAASPPADQAEELPRIGAAERILQVGDHVAIIDGPHRGEHGTIVQSPDWLREGVVSVHLAAGRGTRYVEVAKLARLDGTGRD